MQKDIDFYKNKELVWFGQTDFENVLDNYYDSLKVIETLSFNDIATEKLRFYPLIESAKSDFISTLKNNLEKFYSLCDEKITNNSLTAYYKEGSNSSKTLVYMPEAYSNFSLNLNFFNSLLADPSCNLLILNLNDFFLSEHSLSRAEMESSFSSSLESILAELGLSESELNFFVCGYSALFSRNYFLGNATSYNKLLYYAPRFSKINSDYCVPSSVFPKDTMLSIDVFNWLLLIAYPENILTHFAFPEDFSKMNLNAYKYFYEDFESNAITELGDLHDLYLIKSENDQIIASENSLESLFDEENKAILSANEGVHNNFLSNDDAITELMNTLQSFGVW